MGAEVNLRVSAEFPLEARGEHLFPEATCLSWLVEFIDSFLCLQSQKCDIFKAFAGTLISFFRF